MEYSLATLVDELRKINLKQSEDTIFTAIKPIMKKYIDHAAHWFEDRFYDIDEEQGFGSHLIAENPDHTLAVIITSWPPHRETPPHNHDTWAVIGSIKGTEQNTLWDRHDDGSNPAFADITRAKATTCHSGDIITMHSDDIHSVVNPKNNEISVSLHIYGKHFNHTNRYQFDPTTKTAKPFIVRQNQNEPAAAPA